MSLPCPFCDAPLDDAAVGAGACSRCDRQLVVGERYRIREVLGHGGMATVYGGEGPDGERVAIKVLRLAGDRSDRDGWSAWEMFERSSRVLRELDHERLPEVFSFSREPSGRLVLVREPFDGGTLAERIDSGRRLTVAQMHRLSEELLELLDYLHRLVPPVIHRDIKPANIMFRTRDDWDPVLVDFDTVAAPRGQRTGLTIVATVGYAAPEQYAGEATPRSDLYGLGATLLHLATRTPPDELPHDRGRFQLDGLVDELDPALRRVLSKLVEPDPERRYADAAAALADLRRAQPAATRARSGRGGVAASPLAAEAAAVSNASPGRSGVAATRLAVEAAAASKASPLQRIKRGVLSVVALLAIAGAIHGSVCGSPSWLKRETAECAAGAARSCWKLGTHYERGKGVEMDLPRAVRLFSKSCDKGYAKGCLYYADVLAWGKGTRVDQPKATWAYLRACEAGHARSCQRACSRYKKGTGVKRDIARALKLCKLGCDRGDSYSCNNLALFYRYGTGVARDLSRAERLFDRACDAGDSLACHNLAKMLVDRDPERALALEKKACRGKISRACKAVRAAKSERRRR